MHLLSKGTGSLMGYQYKENGMTLTLFASGT